MILGTVLTGAVAVRTTVVPFEHQASTWKMVLTAAALTGTVVIVIPACYLLAPRSRPASRVDRALWIYLMAELAAVTILGRMSTGAWVNYGIQPVVFFSVLTARALSRGCLGTLPRREHC